MLLIEFTISGTINYISNEGLALTHWFNPYVISLSAPQYRTASDYGGYISLGFGSMSLSPDLFSGDWPPPKQCPISIKYSSTTEEDAVTLFECDAYLEGFSNASVEYNIFVPKYTSKVLDEGPDYDGNTVAYPRAFGIVTHVSPVRLADDGSSQPCYHLGGMGTASDTKAVESITSYSGGTATKMTTSSAHGFSNGNSVSIDGSINFNGTHVISNVTATTFTIPIAFPTDDSESVPLRIGARIAGNFSVYDDGVPIPGNVVVNGDGTFSLSASPVGLVTISGTGSTTTLLAAVTWAQGELGIASIVSTNSRGTSPDLGYWADSQQPLIDFISDICAFFTHYFYIKDDVLTLGDMLIDNGEASVTEFDFFSAGYQQQRAISQIKASWTTHSADTGRVEESDRGHYIKDTNNHLVESLYTISSGTTDGTTADKLVDSGADFVTDEIAIEMVAQNTTDDTYATITAVAATELTLDDDIFVSGENYVVGPSLPYGDEMSVEPYHDTRSNISTALQNILAIMNKHIIDIRIPLDGNLPVPCIKYSWSDTMLVVDSSSYIRVRNMTFDFVNEEVQLSGEGELT